MINATVSAQNNGKDFRVFSLLPKELRMKIWRHAMQQQRFLKVRIKDREHCDPDLADVTSTGERYYAYVDGHQVLSKYLRVNRESREETLRFYRVHLPCRLYTRHTKTGNDIASPGKIYINPEYDYLFISPEWSVKNSLFDFLYHLKNTYDPLGVGLLNIAVDTNSLNANDLYLMQPSDIDTGAFKATQSILTHLREVWFVSTPRAGRQVMGYMSGLPTGDTFWNRSLPIMARPSSFERLERDPRDIADDLKRVHVGLSDPRQMYMRWLDFLDKWGGSAPQINYRFLLAFEPIIGAGEGVLDRRSAVSTLPSFSHVSGPV